jgi:hypothetical protein
MGLKDFSVSALQHFSLLPLRLMPGRALQSGFAAEALAGAAERRTAPSLTDKPPSLGGVLTSC